MDKKYKPLLLNLLVEEWAKLDKLTKHFKTTKVNLIRHLIDVAYDDMENKIVDQTAYMYRYN